MVTKDCTCPLDSVVDVDQDLHGRHIRRKFLTVDLIGGSTNLRIQERGEMKAMDWGVWPPSLVVFFPFPFSSFSLSSSSLFFFFFLSSLSVTKRVECPF